MEDTLNITETHGNNMAPKKKSISLALCLLGGWVGAHKFYEGKILMGLLYLCSCGLYFIGVIIDLIKLLRSPSVYYVKKKDLAYYKNAVVSAVRNFPLDKIGRIVSGAGGAVIGYGVTSEVNFTIILTGLVIAAAGILLTWMKTRDLKDTLVGNGIIIGLLAVGMFALLFLIGAVIVYFAVKAFLGIDLIEWFTDVFGNDQKSGQNEEAFQSTTESALFEFPNYVLDKDGNQYSHSVSHNGGATYIGPGGNQIFLKPHQIDGFRIR